MKEENELDGERQNKLPPAYYEVPSARYSKHKQEPKQDSEPGEGRDEGAMINPNTPLHAEPEPQGLLRVNDHVGIPSSYAWFI